MFENIILNIGFVFSAITLLFYILSIKKPEYAPKARIIYYTTSGFVIISSILLMANIIAHNFQIAYIYEYSSKDLPAYLLISSFFAGQEGSFLLWALMLTIIGIPLIRSSSKNELEPQVMAVFTASLFFFLLLLIIKSPFVYIWDKYPADFTYGMLPNDGRSLNPILENFWLAIHPPFLFAGYALLSVPFSYILGAKIKGSNEAEYLHSRIWLLVSSAVLGAGLILGGFWAYETLGWGGWWGWDPVENSSLIPWLLSVALIHTFIIQRKTGSFANANYALSAIAYFFVIYSTFLTRSGIIQNSQHSFTNTSSGIYYILLVGMTIILAVPLIIYFAKRPKIKSNMDSFKPMSREFMLSIGVFMILASTALITIGTSMPIFSSTISIEPRFYDTVNMPIVIFSLLLLFFAISFKWKEVKLANIKIQLILNFSMAILLTCLAIIWGVRDAYYVVMLFTAFLVLSISISGLIKKIKIKKYNFGINFAHLGFAVLIIGIVFSGAYSKHKSFQLSNKESANIGDISIKYIKSEQIDKQLNDREKYHFIIEAKWNDNTVYLNPITFIKNNQVFREPAIYNAIDKDIYAAPLSLDSMYNVPIGELTKGQALRLEKEKISFKFVQFSMANPEASQIGALVEYEINGKIFTDTAIAALDTKSLACTPIWRTFTDSDLKFGLLKILIDDYDRTKSKAVFAFAREKDLPLNSREVLTFELTIKPFMNLIWLGSIMLIIGTVWAAYKKK